MEEIKREQVGSLMGDKWEKMHEQCRRVYSANGLAPTVHTMGGGGQELKIVEPIAYDEQNGYLRQDGCVGTLTTDGSSPKHNNRIVEPCITRGGVLFWKIANNSFGTGSISKYVSIVQYVERLHAMLELISNETDKVL